ncbi:hypothetical protein QO227_06245 [Vibrio vulnificus]|nr:hypothetical protein [Vibrio vulnificus]MDK2600815.1 hypothetical protein [Vibrio vulnificus]MDK2623923.1 hypothetical protein [Vibrio vulnificus]MDK2641034.1 hypothetical protein [Vibrio vulnificus]MDK2667344.1 hypothetical protein [Vibrio vulnificus]MDK2676726.1 hypothetical protein [Vibrio vulnificus]
MAALISWVGRTVLEQLVLDKPASIASQPSRIYLFLTFAAYEMAVVTL